jgi:Na+/H+ antiporter NhaD/arsenite permease-like protein
MMLAAAPTNPVEPILIAGIPVEFFLFGLTLLGVAVLHKRATTIAFSGLAAIVAFKLLGPGFKSGPGLGGLLDHAAHEWVILANLLGLLVSFALLARQFEDSHVPEALPAVLPDDWTGGLVLLILVFLFSGILDNIAAALIGGTVAKRVFQGRVHIGYVAAIVAASNAGGAGSVLGDTTTTMMWIAGVTPLAVLPAYIAAGAALLVFGIPAARQQHAYQPIQKDAGAHVRIDWMRLLVVAIILLTAIAANVATSRYFPWVADVFPALGFAVSVAIVVTSSIRPAEWSLVPEAAKGAAFLLALVGCASLMPVDRLPLPSWSVTLGLGFVSSIFDNIPLTALAIKQGGFDWALLAFAVGFGGSMLWFGSSAGVAICGLFPEGRSAIAWVKAAWYVPIAYVIGFVVLLLVRGWRPDVG